MISVHPGKHPGGGVGSLFHFFKPRKRGWKSQDWLVAGCGLDASLSDRQRVFSLDRSCWGRIEAGKEVWLVGGSQSLSTSLSPGVLRDGLLVWKRAGVGARQGFLVTDASLIKPRRNMHGRHSPHPPLPWTVAGFASQEWLLVSLASALPPSTWKCLRRQGPGMALRMTLAGLKASLAS